MDANSSKERLVSRGMLHVGVAGLNSNNRVHFNGNLSPLHLLHPSQAAAAAAPRRPALKGGGDGLIKLKRTFLHMIPNGAGGLKKHRA